MTNFFQIDSAFTKTPFFAALPIAETIETGVEITNEQGHPTTKMDNPW